MSNMDSADLSSGEQSPPDETDTAPLEPPQSVSTDMHLILEQPESNRSVQTTPEIGDNNSETHPIFSFTTPIYINGDIQESTNSDRSISIKIIDKTKKFRNRKLNLSPSILQSKNKIKSEEDKLKEHGVSEGSNEFSHRDSEDNVSISLRDLCNVQKQGEGASGKVLSIVVKKSRDIPIAVKCIEYYKIRAIEIEIMKDICTGFCPYIIDYYCAFLNPKNGSLYICMEFMDTSLENFYSMMHKEEKLSCDSIDRLLLRIIHDISGGLGYMERKEIVHRDLKPSNMLINKTSTIKLCDFGISRSYPRLERYHSDSYIPDDLNSPLSPLAHTLNYIPPKVECTIKDDMWALGISLLEIISGKNPFDEWETSGRQFALMNWTPYVPGIVSEGVREIILKLLQHDSSKRFNSYSEILELPCMENISETPSNDECEFVCNIIAKISNKIS